MLGFIVPSSQGGSMAQQVSAVRLRVAIAILFSVILIISLLPLSALASDPLEAQTSESLECGNCTWTIDDEGALIIEPKSGTNGKLASLGENDLFPWVYPNYQSRITSVIVKPGVKAEGNLGAMFSPCSNLKTADLSGLDTTGATNMGSMFGGCKSLVSIKLAGFNTAQVKEMNGMFAGCEKLEELDLSSFDTNQVESMENMFKDCGSLKKVTVGSEFSFNGADDNGCTLTEGNWLSTKDNKIYTAVQIATDRNGIADTYIKDGTPIVEEKPEPTKPDEPRITSEVIYRLYNPNSGEHFYTASEYERNFLINIGWSNENIGWVAPSTGAEVYRVYNPNVGGHFYTLSAYERDFLVNVGWNYEGVCWYSDSAQDVPLYRVYNPNAYAFNHFWTASAYERDFLINIGWNDEGIGWYALAE